MPPIFMLVLPAPIGMSPESHNGVLCLLAHASEAGRSLALESRVIATGEEGEAALVQVTLREVSPHAQPGAA